MNNCNILKHPIHILLDELFAEGENRNVIAEYQCRNSTCSKWIMFSDYCYDDKNKSNDVMTFVLMPFESEAKFTEMQKKIHDMQSSDIKETKTINKAFLSYLKSANILIFSFVLDDRKYFLAPSYRQCLEGVKGTLQTICNCYEKWEITADNKDILGYYKGVVSMIKKQLATLNSKSPNIKLLNDILITAFLGAYVSVKVLKNLSIEIFGWFSDRDKVISGKDNIIAPIFNYYQHNMLGDKQFKFCTFTPDDKVKPFFDDFNRIADVVTGAIADYNLEEDYITNDKFNEVLIHFLADNKQVFIFRIHKIQGSYTIGQITMHPK